MAKGTSRRTLEFIVPFVCEGREKYKNNDKSAQDGNFNFTAHGLILYTFKIALSIGILQEKQTVHV
jgi:hypothetical protein